ncbi:MAG: hypothetical protein ACRDP9_01620 [Kribbellaceae bacterium]
MWVFLSRRFRLWLILVIGLPLLDWLLGKLSDTIRARKGEGRITRGIDTTREGVRVVRNRGR